MKKLKLEVEALEVECFAVAETGERRRTVVGYVYSAYPDPCGSYISICHECPITFDMYACTDFDC
ncbi:MAG TPA: hypothetical protein VHG91_03040 [Longimicrobium sp.]|nr:hypothetical protein [Longimicrobium sp.]